jgi:serine/threonine protein kinase
MRLTPGTQLGPYEVVAFLGAGGMAEVYRARDGRLQRDVALKVVGANFYADDEFMARLEQEARLAGSLNHPNILAVHDVGVHEGCPYVVTELLQGETLRERLARGPVSLSSALDWAVQMARGVAAAHERGIIHRDLKPENVFLTLPGLLKLLDFGLAKGAASTAGPRGLLEATLGRDGAATQSGAILGTPGYMSPEQVRGEPVDFRSDVFSLGALIYELLAGHRAFPGRSLIESGYAILHADPKPLPSSVPAPLAELVKRCLGKEPQHRFQSAQDLAFSLDAIRAPSGPVPTPHDEMPTPVRTRSSWRWAVLATALIALLPAFLFGRRSAPVGKLPTVRRLTFQRAAILAARFAPDGRTVHFSRSTGQGPPEIETTTVVSPQARPTGIDDAQLLGVSRTGELAVVLHPRFAWFDAGRGTLARTPAVGGTPRELTLNVEYADWAPDGEHLAVARYEGERSRLEYPIGTVVFESSGFISHPRVSPDGDRVAFIDHPLTLDSAGMVMVVDRAGHSEQWGGHFGDALGLAWRPDGREVLVTASDGTQPAALRGVSKTGERVLYRGTAELLVNDVAPDGRVLLTQRDWRQAIELSRTGEPVEMLDSLDWAVLSGLSEDGTAVLWGESGLGVEGQPRAFLQKAGQSGPIDLGPGRPLALSPDGKRALVWRDGPPGTLWLVPTGPGEPRVIKVPGLLQIDNAAFFRDGRRLAVVGRGDPVSLNRLYVFDQEQARLVALSPPGLPRFQFTMGVSPDQKWVASLDPNGVVIAYPVDGGEPIRAPEWGIGRLPGGWLADGELLSFKRFDVPSRVERFDLRTRRTASFGTVAPSDPAGVVRIVGVQVTPDGRTTVVNHRRMSGVLLTLDWGEAGGSSAAEKPANAGWLSASGH